MSGVKALLYTQVAAYDPNCPETCFKFKELWVDSPYHMIINWCPESMYAGKSSLHIFRSQSPRLVSTPTFVSEPIPITDVTSIQVNKDWLDRCMGLLNMKETYETCLEEISTTKPQEFH